MLGSPSLGPVATMLMCVCLVVCVCVHACIYVCRRCLHLWCIVSDCDYGHVWSGKCVCDICVSIRYAILEDACGVGLCVCSVTMGCICGSCLWDMCLQNMYLCDINLCCISFHGMYVCRVYL